MKKKKLAMVLSKLAEIPNPKLKLEQYPVSGDLAAEILILANNFGDINKRIVADLGCGGGRLGLGALILGAKKVYLIDVDESSLKVAEKNYKFIEKDLKGRKAIFLKSDVRNLEIEVDTVIQNPPFGTRKRKIDTLFVEVALRIAKVVYSLHKKGNLEYFQKKFNVTNVWRMKFEIWRMFDFHEKRKILLDVELLRFER